ncbi:MAG: glycerate kinase [Saprospiraceae bacterium]
MNILILPDKFKDALSSREVADAMAEGLRGACPDAHIEAFSMADGGEGSLDAWLQLEDAVEETAEVMDPLMRPVRARFGLSRDGKTAFVEMAQASGLALLKLEERNCWYTSTFGTGELIAKALGKGVQRIILSVGGSATVDGGTGMAAALGFRFFDEKRQLISPTGGSLLHIHAVEKGGLHPRLGDVAFEVWTDVGNPLCGLEGAAYTFARQKGATEAQLPLLDEGLRHLSEILGHPGDFPGAGAAGGLAYGAVAFLSARVLSGADQFLSYPAIREAFARADVIFTGEGRLDGQTRYGKLIHAVCRRAAERKTPVIALCGAVEASEAEIADLGLLAAFSVNRAPGPLPALLPRTRDNLRHLAGQLGRVLCKLL